MFAKRDWGMISLIILAQVGLVICYWGLQPQNNQPKLASAFVVEPKTTSSPESSPASPATQVETVAKIGLPPEPPGELIPASLKQVSPLAKNDSKLPELPPPLVKSDSKLPEFPLPPLPALSDKMPDPSIPSLPPVPSIEDQLAQQSKKPEDKINKEPNSKEPKIDIPPPPPGIPEPVKVPPTVSPAPGAPNIPIPPSLPSTKSDFPEPAAKTDAPKPETNIKPPAIPEAPPLVPLEPGKANGVDPAEITPTPPVSDPKKPSIAPGPAPLTPTPPPKMPAPSPWKLQMALVNQRTHVTARTDKGTVFVIRCQQFQFARAEGKIEATGKVEIEGKELQASCDRLTISWSDNRMFLEGNAALKNWRNGEMMTLKGPQLELQLSGVEP